MLEIGTRQKSGNHIGNGVRQHAEFRRERLQAHDQGLVDLVAGQIELLIEVLPRLQHRIGDGKARAVLLIAASELAQILIRIRQDRLGVLKADQIIEAAGAHPLHGLAVLLKGILDQWNQRRADVRGIHPLCVHLGDPCADAILQVRGCLHIGDVGEKAFRARQQAGIADSERLLIAECRPEALRLLAGIAGAGGQFAKTEAADQGRDAAGNRREFQQRPDRLGDPLGGGDGVDADILHRLSGMSHRCFIFLLRVQLCLCGIFFELGFLAERGFVLMMQFGLGENRRRHRRETIGQRINRLSRITDSLVLRAPCLRAGLQFGLKALP